MNDGRKKKSQKHKNRTAFKITFDTQALQLQKKVSLTNLCIRCTQQMEWKLQYNKYKKMTEPGRCNYCTQKNVYRTYMKACQPCIQEKQVCAKCLTPDYEAPAPEEVKISQKDQKQQSKAEYNNQVDFMKTLQQRSRRTVRRGLEKNKISWDAEQQYFVDEEGKKMIGLHFRKGFRIGEDGENQDDDNDPMDDLDEDQEDMFGDEDDEDNMDQGEQETKQSKQNKKQQKHKQEKGNAQNKTTQNESKQAKKSQNGVNENQDEDKSKSDVQGDEVDCENDHDFNDQDFEDDDQQQEEKPPQKSKNKNQKKTTSK